MSSAYALDNFQTIATDGLMVLWFEAGDGLAGPTFDGFDASSAGFGCRERTFFNAVQVFTTRKDARIALEYVYEQGRDRAFPQLWRDMQYRGWARLSSYLIPPSWLYHRQID